MKKLDVGCGNTMTAGFERADIDPMCPDLDFVCDMAAIPVPDGTYDVVRSSHNIEHCSIEAAERALREWFRILKPGGMVWIDTPNIERNLDLYHNATWMRDFNTLTAGEQARCSTNGKPDAAKWLNFKVFSTDSTFNTHYWNATPALLTQMCEDAGFERVEVLQTDPSLIVRAWKP